MFRFELDTKNKLMMIFNSDSKDASDVAEVEKEASNDKASQVSS